MRSTTPHRSGRLGQNRLEPPAWATAAPGSLAAKVRTSLHGVDVEVQAGFDWTLARAVVTDAVDLAPLKLQRHCRDAFLALATSLCDSAAPRHPVRFWNFIPRIGQMMGDDLDRYMVFNAGRFAAFHAWPARDAGNPWTATASGVGHDDRDLVIWCLASNTPGIALENPRQTPVRQYSPRYGPMPPSFSRATVIADSVGLSPRHPRHSAEVPATWLLVGGTASIRGEQSLHAGNLPSQIDETLANLDALVVAARVMADPSGQCSPTDNLQPMQNFTDLRVYYVQPDDLATIQMTLAERLLPSCEVEWICADLCRPELLVEIEGVARVNQHVRSRKPTLAMNHA